MFRVKKRIWGICAAGVSVLCLQSIMGQPLRAADQPFNETAAVRSAESSETEETSPQQTSAEKAEQGVIPETVPETSTVPSNPKPEVPAETGSSSVQSTTESSAASSSQPIVSSTASSSPSTAPSESSTSSSTAAVPSTSSSSSEPEGSKPSTSPTPSKQPTRPTPSSPPKQPAGTGGQTARQSSSPAVPSVSEVPPSTAGEEKGNFSEVQPATALSQLDEVVLDDTLRVSEVSESDLKGFELPLLNTFKDKSQAVLVYEGIKQVGTFQITTTAAEKGTIDTSQTFQSTEELINRMCQHLFGQSLTTAQKQSLSTEKKQAGDLLYKENQLFGLYLGSDHYLVAGEPTEKELTEHPEWKDHKIGKIALFSDQKELEQTLRVQRLTNQTLTDYGNEVRKAYPASMDFSENDQTQAFIASIAKSAQKLGLDYDVFASVMIAQAILESGSGTSTLSAAPNYNLFGVKGSYEGNSVNFSTQEDRGNGAMYTIQAAFRRYPSYAESLGDYVTLIRGGIQGNEQYYQDAWRSQAKNYLRAAASLTGKYATDTTYHRKISSLIAAYHLTQYDLSLPEETVTGIQTSAVMQGKETIPAAYQEKMTYPEYDGKNYNLSGSYPVGQCTWYAYNRVAQLGKRVDEYMGNGGEWGASAKRFGYQTSQTPKAGWLISFSPGTAGSDPRYGHVAFVEAVTEEGILISEGNVVGGTIISYRIIPNSLASSSLVTYIEPK